MTRGVRKGSTMSVHLLKVYRVVPSEPSASWQPELDPEVYRSQDLAERMAHYYSNEHGLADTTVEEYSIECLVIDGTVYVPDYVQ